MERYTCEGRSLVKKTEGLKNDYNENRKSNY